MKCHDAVQFPYLYNDILFLYTFLNVLSGFQQDEVYHIEIVELLAKLMNNSSKTSTVQIKRIKPSIIYRLLLIGLGSPMVIYGWFARSPSKREIKLLTKHAPETHFCWRSLELLRT